MIGVPDAFEDSAAALGGAGRRNVVREARDEHTVDLQRSARLHEHFAERPGGQTAAARRRTDAVADVAQIVVELVTQRDASHDLSVFEDPSRRAVAHVRTRSPSGMGESEAVLHPVRETLSGVQVVFFGHAEAVLVKPGPPVVPTLQEGGVEPRAGRNQFLHEIEPTRGWRTGPVPTKPLTHPLAGGEPVSTSAHAFLRAVVPMSGRPRSPGQLRLRLPCPAAPNALWPSHATDGRRNPTAVQGLILRPVEAHYQDGRVDGRLVPDSFVVLPR